MTTTLGFVALGLVLLVFTGRPLATDDTWWHLAYGAAHARQGPWLAEDPLLFTAPAGPAPAAWLADLALHATLETAGFGGLRLLHVALTLAIVILAFALLRRASASSSLACALCACFIALAGYRVTQLRPELFTLLATLLLARAAFEPAPPLSWRRIAGLAAGCALWSNLHAGFVLGPVLLGSAAASLGVAALLRPATARADDLARAKRFGAAFCAALIGSCANPAGVRAYRPLLAAGSETPALARVADEWTPLGLFVWPSPSLPGGLTGLLLVWALLVATAWIAFRALPRWRRGEGAVDPVSLGLAVAALLAMLAAVRFLWLAIFPLLLVAHALRASRWLEAGAAGRPAAALALTLLVVAGTLRVGDGRRWLAELPRSAEAYAVPFHAARYFGHATWLLADAELEGRLFADYSLGGFLGYWLAPRVRCFANGSLNVRPEAMAANLPLRARRGERAGESFLELLDRHGIDLYLGTRLPEEGPVGRPWFATTTHLEGAPGWRLVFRNLRSALYLRADARNAGNLSRVAAYYEARGVPFDPTAGFDVARVILQAPRFALEHGIVPRGFPALVATRHGVGGSARDAATDRLASLYAVLSLYEPAIRLDRGLAGDALARPLVQRRSVWSLLRVGRAHEAFELARVAEPTPGPASLWRPLAETARALREAPPQAVKERTLSLPFLTRVEAARTLAGFVHPRTRPPRDRDSS